MAIERKTYSYDTPMEDPETDSPTEEAGETTELPISMLGGQQVQPGDIVRLEVVSADEGSGVIKVKYASPHDEPEDMGGIEGAASKFEE